MPQQVAQKMAKRLGDFLAKKLAITEQKHILKNCQTLSTFQQQMRFAISDYIQKNF